MNMTACVETHRYLAPIDDPWFWHWDIESEDLATDVVVWTDGGTIAFRPEIREVLEALAPAGFPPFDAVVLLLAACRESWEHCRSQLAQVATDAADPNLAALVDQLGIVHSLPASLRKTVQSKALLAGIVFEGATGRGHPADAARVLAEFDQFDPHASPREALVTSRDQFLRRQTRGLASALERMDCETLRLRVQTGLDELLKAAELVLPVADRARHLLAELEQDPQWQGLARLTRRLMAAISLPQPISDRDDLPLGGVSDITNRAQLDRLLLSELAQDDLMFTARLAMGELLYLRRETLPRPRSETRWLLLDCGLRLWGVPRIFATAVALALVATSRTAGDVKVFRAAGSQVEPVDLLSRAGLIQHLAALEPTLHPGEALAPFLAAPSADSPPITPILVTSKETPCDPEFRACLREHASQGLYTATVTREGQFCLSWLAEHGRRSLSEAQLSLDEILQSDRPVIRQCSQLLDPQLPRIFQAHPFPLRIPYSLSNAIAATAVESESFLVVTHDRRLLCFAGRAEYPMQLSDQVPPGRICWLSPDESPHLVRAVFFASPYHKATLLEIDVDEGCCRLQPLADASRRAQLGAAFHQGAVFLMGHSCIEAFSLQGKCLARLRVPRRLRYVPPGRFFWDPARKTWYALSLKGTQVQLEEVTCATGDRMPQIVRLVDVVGSDGPLGIDLEGAVFDTATGTWHRDDPGIWSRDLFGMRRCYQQVLAISRDGQHAAVRVERFHGGFSILNDCLHLDMKSGRLGRPLRHSRPHVELEFGGWMLNRLRMDIGSVSRRHKLTSAPSLPSYFTQVSVDSVGQIELTARSGRRDSFDRSLFWTRSFGPSRSVEVSPIAPPRRASFTYVRAPYSSERSIRLHVAVFPDGSRIYVDSRGLLHLVSAAAELPDVTLVLPSRNGSELTGWCSDGTWFGDPRFHFATAKGICSARSIFGRVIDPFMRHISSVICPPGR